MAPDMNVSATRRRSSALCILAHNEAHRLPDMLTTLSEQDVFQASDVDVQVVVVANGCTDDTVNVAKAHPIADRLGAGMVVLDLEEGGKSNAWNHVVHSPETNEIDVLIFCDADIEFGDPHTLGIMLDSLDRSPEAAVWVSRPEKRKPGENAGLVERIVYKATGTGSNWRNAICGQLYAIRGTIARDIWMPIGLPVEDGFLRAMVLTDCFDHPEDLRRIDGREDVVHWFEPERELRSLIRHQTRLVTGSAINTAIYRELDRSEPNARRPLLEQAASDADWVPQLLEKALPRFPYGWVPWSFLTGRSTRILRAAATKSGFRKLPLLPVFFLFDLICWTLAQIRLGFGRGAGFW